MRPRPRAARGAGAALLSPGRGPLRPPAEEAGRRDDSSRGARLGNAATWEQQPWRGRRESREWSPARLCAQSRPPPASCRGPSPAAGGRGGSFCAELKRIPGRGRRRRRLACCPWLLLVGAVFPLSSSSLSCCSFSADRDGLQGGSGRGEAGVWATPSSHAASAQTTAG